MEVESRIVQKAKELFQTRGIKNVTVDQICFEIGISKRTLYEVFKDKDELIAVVLKHISEELYREHRKILDSSENVIDALTKYQKNSMKSMSKVNCLFYEDLKRFYPALLEYFFPKDDKEKSISYLLLDRGIKEGIFRSELNPAILSEFVQNFMMSLFQSGRGLFEVPPTQEEVKVNIMEPLFRGISTEKGLKLAAAYIANKQNEK